LPDCSCPGSGWLAFGVVVGPGVAVEVAVGEQVLALIENDQCCSLKVTTLACVQGSAM
jgi:hypothetical protein